MADIPNTTSAVLPIYARAPIAFERGEGAYLFTKSGERYLDFAAGIAVCALGHSHPHLVNALVEQAKKVWHVSNLFEIPEMDRLAGRLAAHSFADKVFFTNSGAEAIECGLKMIRKFHDETGNPDKFRVITFTGAFHGRTMATISAGRSEKVMKGFEPAVEGFDQVPWQDIEAVKNAITPKTGGILVEPIQGEGGIKPSCHCFMQNLRKLCDEHGLLLMFDEVQCGMGRTGKLFAHEWYGVTPDIMALAKGIGGGFPLGACLTTDKVAITMKQGSHGTTYGSNPLAMAVGNAVLDVLLEPNFMPHTLKTATGLKASLDKLSRAYPHVIEEARGLGLILGLKVKPLNTEFVEKLRKKKLLSVAAGENVVRLLPPLIIGEKEVEEALTIIESVCQEYPN